MSDQQQAKITISAEEQGLDKVLKAVESLTRSMESLERQLKSYDQAMSRSNLASVKANAEYEKLYGNTAKLKDAHQQATQAVDKHTSSWLQHIASVAGGIIVYQGIREAMRLAIGFFYGGIKAVSDYEDAIIGMSAMWTTLAKDQSNIPETFKLNVQYAKDLIPVMQQIDIYSGMNLDQLLQMNMAFATQGVVLNKNNQDQIQGYTNISNAILFLTKGQSSSRQIQQEIKAVMQGQLRDSDALAKVLASQIGPEYKKQIADWKAIGQASGDSGFIIAKIGEHLKGYTEAMNMMQGSWNVLRSSLETTWTILERDVFTPILKDWKVGLEAVNTYLRAHSKEISENIYNGWVKFKNVLTLVKDNIGGIKLATEGLLLVFTANTAVKFISELALNFGKLAALATGAWATISMGAAEATTLIEVLGVSTGGVSVLVIGALAAVGTAIYGIYKNWDYLVQGFNDDKATTGLSTVGSTFQHIGSIVGNLFRLVSDLWKKFTEYDVVKSTFAAIGETMSSLGSTIKDVVLWALEQINLVLGWIDTKLKEIRLATGVQASEKARADANAPDFMSRSTFPGVKPRTLAEQVAYDNYNAKPYIPQLNELGTNDKTKSTTERFSEFNALANALNKIEEELNKAKVATLSLDDAQVELTKAEKDFETKKKASWVLNQTMTGSEAESLVGKNKLKRSLEDLNLADKTRKDMTSVVTKLQNEYNTVVDKAEKMLAKSIITTKTATEARADVTDAESQLMFAMLLGSAAVNYQKESIDKLTIAREEETAAAKAGEKALDTINKKFKYIGDFAKTLFGDTAGPGISSVMESLTILNNPQALDKFAADNKLTVSQAQMSLYTGIADSVGKMVGGQVGKSVSGAAQGAMVGSLIPGIGTIAGGVIGLISSFFGGNSAKEQQHQQEQNNALSMTGNINSMASGGNVLAQAFMRSANYNTNTLADLNSNTLYQGKTRSNIGDLLPVALRTAKNIETFANATLTASGNEQNILDYLSAFDTIDKSLKSMTSASIVSTLDQITYKYDAIIAKIRAER